MSNFKAGDKVRIKGDDDVFTIMGISGREGKVYFDECASCVKLDEIEYFYPNPPLKHKDLIIEWANGADIQAWSDSSHEWVYVSNPNWYEWTEYRVKPQKSEKNLEIESIQKQMDELKERLEKLKGE